MDCPICFGKHDTSNVCDSPGAIVTFTTGCPVHDALKVDRRTEEQKRRDELRAKVDLELQGAIW